MLATELRAHLRVRSDAHALLHLPSGKTLPAVVSDISIGGAYLIRGGSPPFAPLAVGDLIDIQLDLAPREFPLLVEAEVIRCEADGPGLAVRFNVYDDIAPGFMDFMTTEAMAAGVDVAALGTPLLMRRRPTSHRTLHFWLIRAAPIAALAAIWWGLRIVIDWLGAVL
jgi:hypothetical protein